MIEGTFTPHGHKNTEGNNIRNDSSNIIFAFIRLLLSFAVMASFLIGVTDIKSAYL